jgi:uncharacterized membrane protein YczE
LIDSPTTRNPSQNGYIAFVAGFDIDVSVNILKTPDNYYGRILPKATGFWHVIF